MGTSYALCELEVLWRDLLEEVPIRLAAHLASPELGGSFRGHIPERVQRL